MAQKEYNIAFKLAAKLSGQFSKTFAAAEKNVGALNQKIGVLDVEAGKLDGLIDMRNRLNEVARASISALKDCQKLEGQAKALGQETQALAAEHAAAKRKLADYEEAINSTEKASDDLISAYSEQEKRVAKLAKAVRAAQGNEKAFAKTVAKSRAVYEGTRQAVDRQKKSVMSLDAELGTTGRSTSDLVKRQKQLAEVADSAAKAQKRLAAVEKAQQMVGAANNVAKWGSRVAGGAVASGVAAAAPAGLAALKMGSEYQAAMNKLQASTGATNAEMEKLEASARGIYTSGIGESFSEVASAMATVRQVSGLTGQALESASKNALVLSKNFDMDVNESARASAALMKNFGISSEQAYDLIAYAAQNGANKNGDLLDTLNEYAVQYKAMGFSAEEFTAHLIKGAQDGAFSIDKIGDAIKEFNIRAKDGSKSSMEAFAMLGMSGQTATQMFAAGGKDAQIAFAQVVERLKAMDDPVKQNAIAVALFGTQFEDLQVKALDGFASIQGASLQAEGTMGKVAKKTTEDLGSQVSIIVRKFQDQLAPASKTAAEAMAANMGKIGASIEKLGPYFTRFADAFVDMLPKVVEWATGLMTKVGTVAAFISEHFAEISSVAGLVVKVMLGLRVGLIAANVFLSVAHAGLMAQKAFLALKQSQTLVVAGTKALTIAMKTGGLIAKGFGIAMTAAQGAVRGVGLALRFLATNPVGLALTAFATLAIAGNYIIKNWDSISAKAAALYQSFQTNLVEAMAPLVAQFQAIWTSIQGVITGIVDFVKNVFTGQWAAAWENAKTIFSSAFNALSGIAKAPLNTLIALINSVIKSLNKMASFKVPEWVPGIGGEGFTFNIPEIPLLAQGGIATKPTLATIAEGGEAEAVIPLSKLNQMLDPMSEPAADAPISRASRALGMNSPSSTTNVTESRPVTVNFSPVINVQGNDASVEERIRQALDEGQRQFEERLQRLLDRDARLAY